MTRCSIGYRSVVNVTLDDRYSLQYRLLTHPEQDLLVLPDNSICSLVISYRERSDQNYIPAVGEIVAV